MTGSRPSDGGATADGPREPAEPATPQRGALSRRAFLGAGSLAGLGVLGAGRLGLAGANRGAAGALADGAGRLGLGDLARNSLLRPGAGSGNPFGVAFTSGIDTLNPITTVDVMPAKIDQLLFPVLVNRSSPTAPLVPDFARSWKLGNGGLSITFALRRGSWSDGRPLTAADAAFTINTLVHFQSGPTANLASYVDGITGATVSGDSLVIHYSRPVAAALDNLCSIPILPAHVWQPLAKGSGAGLKTFQVGAGAVTGGPFVLSSYSQNQAVVLSANPKAYVRPRTTEIGFLPSASEAGALSALSSGQADAVDAGAVVPEGLSTLGTGRFDVGYGPGLIWYEIAFNSNPKKTRHRELLDPRVRTALSMATDRKRIVEVALFGHGQPGSTLVPPAMGAYHNSSIPVDPFDLARADAALDKLGYKKGSNGIRVANGAPMSYSMPLANDMPYQPIFDIISRDWRAVGVELHGQPMDGSAEYLATTNPNGKYLQNDVSMWWWAGQLDPNFFLSLLTTAQLDGYSDTGYSNPAYDKLFAQQAQALDPSRRRSLIWQMQQIAQRDKPYLVLCYVDAFSAVNRQWQGVKASPLGDFPQTSKQWALSVHQG